jgi:hypothetical protein
MSETTPRERFDFDEWLKEISSQSLDQQFFLITEKYHQVWKELNIIKARVEEGEAKIRQSPDDVDANWFYRVNAAYRAKAYQVQRLQEARGRVKKRIKHASHLRRMSRRGVPSYFMDVAREELSLIEFTRLKGIAEARKAENDATEVCDE